MRYIDKFTLLFAIAFVLSFVGGVLSFNNEREFINNAIEVEGEVVQFVKRLPKANSIPLIHPVVQIISNDGTEHQFVSNIGANTPQYEISEKVRVLYRPGDLGSSKIKGFFYNWFSTFVLLGMATGFLGFALFLHFWIRPTENTYENSKQPPTNKEQTQYQVVLLKDSMNQVKMQPSESGMPPALRRIRHLALLFSAALTAPTILVLVPTIMQLAFPNSEQLDSVSINLLKIAMWCVVAYIPIYLVAHFTSYILMRGKEYKVSAIMACMPLVWAFGCLALMLYLINAQVVQL